MAQGSLTAAGSGEEVVPASDYRGVAQPGSRASRLLGKKTLETELFSRRPGTRHVAQKDSCRCGRCRRRTKRDEDVAEVIVCVSSTLGEPLQDRPPRRLGRPPLADEELVAQIKAAIAELPTYRRGSVDRA